MTLPITLRRKVCTNDPPTPQEIAAIRKALTATLDKVHALENEIVGLQKRYSSLRRESRELTAFIEDHKRLLSPARRLLPEILQEIFCHCLPVAHNAILDARSPPLLLGQVCSQWRQIAYSTPRLWTSIHISARPIHLRNFTGSSRTIARKDAISAWLSRSGVLPLSISMYCNGLGTSRTGSPINSEVQPYLDVIVSHARRWKIIHFTLRYFDWAPFFAEFAASDFPSLESLHIDGDYDMDLTPPSPIDLVAPLKGDNILQAPLLRVLSLPTYTPHVFDLGLQWKNITGLNLGNSSLLLGEISRALTLCPNLEFCSVSPLPGPRYLTLTGSPSPYDMAEVVLPRLQTLVVVNRSGIDETSRRLFSCLSAPALRHLSYSRTSHVYPDSPGVRDSEILLSDAIRSFLQRLIHPLEELSIWTNPFHGTFVMDILPLVPELKRLSLKGRATLGSDSVYSPPLHPLDCPMDDLFLANFIPNHIEEIRSPISFEGDDDSESDESSIYRQCVCPKLEVLYLSDAHFTDSMVVDFLRSRSTNRQTDNVAHLRRVSIYFNSLHDQSVEITRQIESIERETGLRVDLRHPTAPFRPFPPSFPAYSPSPYSGLRYSDTTNTEAAPPPHLLF